MGNMLGAWGRQYEKNLQENRPDIYRELKERGLLEEHLSLVDQQAADRFQSTMQALEKQDPYPANFAKRAARIAQDERVAQEVASELVQVPDKFTARAMQRGGY